MPGRGKKQLRQLLSQAVLLPSFLLVLVVEVKAQEGILVPETVTATETIPAPAPSDTPVVPETPAEAVVPESPASEPSQETILPPQETASPETPAEQPVVPETTTPETPPAETSVPAPVLAPEPIPVTENTETAETTEEVPAPPEEVVPTEVVVDYSADYALYKKYLLFQKFEKRALYLKYKRYRELVGKYPWENKKAEKKVLKSLKKDAKKYYKKPGKYPHLRARASDYSNYGALKAEYFSLKTYASYADFIRYDRDEYAAYEQYGGEAYKTGYERYQALLAEGKVTDRGDADVEADALGPEITVGLFHYTTKELKENSFSIKANKPFFIKDRKDETLATIPADTKIRVKYVGDKKLHVYNSATDETLATVSKEVRFEGEAKDKAEIIFDTNRPNSSFDRYRGSIRLRYYDAPEADGDRIWVINALPLEHYVWGMGEITGTGPSEYNRVMTTIFRTYGYWKIKWSTKYADQGFKVDATPGNQLYYGYDWEVTHGAIRAGAEATRGKLVMHDREIALTPYSSWTDGSTRRFEDGHWGRACKTASASVSALYPWLNAVGDSRGKHESKNTCELAAGGNHMVGLSANGAVRMAKYDNATFDQILEHYYAGVELVAGY